jgi:hypothetical protein
LTEYHGVHVKKNDEFFGVFEKHCLHTKGKFLKRIYLIDGAMPDLNMIDEEPARFTIYFPDGQKLHETLVIEDCLLETGGVTYIAFSFTTDEVLFETMSAVERL